MILGGFIVQVNAEIQMQDDNFAYLHFSNNLSLSTFCNSFLEHNSAAVWNILMILGRITEQVSAKCLHFV